MERFSILMGIAGALALFGLYLLVMWRVHLAGRPVTPRPEPKNKTEALAANVAHRHVWGMP